MKKILIFSLLLLTSSFMSGCEEYLTEDDPLNITDEGWWDAPDNGNTALGTVYGARMGGTGVYNGLKTQSSFSVLSDEAVVRLDANWEQFSKGIQTANINKAQDFWSTNYLHIRRANRFLAFSDRIFLPDSIKNQQRLQARALRAIYHFELLQLYGGVPIVDKVVLPNENELRRNTEAEVANFIRAELTECANNLNSVTELGPSQVDRISSGACWAYLSRLGLHIKDYALARDAAKKIIDSGEYELYRNSNPSANHFAILFSYAGELNKERIVIAPNGAAPSWTNFAPQGSGGNSSTYVSPTAAIVDAFETKQGKTIFELGPDSVKIYQANPNYRNNRDPRLAASIIAPNELFPAPNATYRPNPFNNAPNNVDRISLQKSTATGFWIRKYLDVRDRSQSRTLDFMNIRYAEVLLNYVEALIELGQWDHPDVFTHLNDIRTRAKMKPVDITRYNSQAKMRELVRRERQVELAFEGIRYFDMLRWDIGEQIRNGIVYGAVDPATKEQVEVETRSFTEKDKLWPIPLREINANPNMEQNDGY